MKQYVCDSNRLVKFLESELSERDETELKTHLGACPTCASELEELAAKPERWSAVKSHLSRDKSGDRTAPSAIPGKLPSFTTRQVVTMLDPTDEPTSLGRMGGYEVLGVVGSGAMGVVLKAADRSLDRIVALKVMNPTLAACGTARQRFAREAKAAAGVLHPNVIAIHGVSTDRELPYLVMPYISGTSLQQRMDRDGPLAVTEVLRIGNQIAAGLAAAHQQGVIHRDIKPSNVMLDDGVETAVITDFGLARTIDDATMTRTGAIAGTPEFMSPEQARGEAIECSSDVFSLGSVLFALCCGKPPFRAKTSFGVLRRITDEAAASIRDSNPDVPVWLCRLINRMLDKDSSARPTAVKVRDLLEQGLAHLYQPDRIPLPAEFSPQSTFRSIFTSIPILTGAFTVMTLIFAAILAVAMQQAGDTNLAKPVQVQDEPTIFKTLNLSFADQERRGTLDVDINRGFVEVEGHDRPDVIIEVLTPPRFEKSADLGELKEIFAPKYDLVNDREGNLIKLDTYNQDYALNLRIKVPYETDLVLDTYYDGYLEVKNVSGTIEASSQNCDIRLLDISGAATASGYNGDYTIQFREVSPTAKLDFESYNGSIDLTLPANLGATAAISSGRGAYRSGFMFTPIDEEELRSLIPKAVENASEYQFGKINGGGVPLRIESQKGLIQIRKREQ